MKVTIRIEYRLQEGPDEGANRQTGIGIYGAGTGISIYGAGTGISVQNTGIAENRPRNISVAAFVKY